MKVRMQGLMVVALFGALSAGAPDAGAAGLAVPVPGQQNGRVAGYFIEWGIYGRGFVPKKLVESGSASRLSHIIYAFAKIGPDLKCAAADSWADYQRPFPAAEDVNGEDEGWSDTQLRGNFNQLAKLKQRFPQVKVLIAIGGWTFSDKFSDAALTDDSRRTLASSCIDMFVKGNLDDGRSAAGVIDGIDIDWEYPGACGNTCDFRPEDTHNFTRLMAEFRHQLDALGRETHKHYLLTAATPAGQWLFNKIELGKVQRFVDFLDLMCYDYHGTWESTTNFHSPLFAAAGDPNPGDAALLNTDFTVRSYLNAGVPPEKIGVGLPFYGRGWAGVPDVSHGLFQSSTGPAPGTYEAGVEDFKVLDALAASSGVYHDPSSKGAWLYSPTTGDFWGYDDREVVRTKAQYVKKNRLGGLMFWELSGDSDEGTLVRTMRNVLR